MQLFRASKQWSIRPPDERFASVSDMYLACKAHQLSAKQAEVPYGSLRVEAQGDDVLLMGKSNIPARLSHWAFGQLSARISAPASYLRQLPATLASQNINYGLAHLGEEDANRKKANILFHNGDGSPLLARAITSDRYSRIWNHEILERLLDLPECWQPAPGTTDGSRGLYASDHDMFAFMVDSNRRVFESDPNGGLSRGFFVENSEVGASALHLMTFLYRYVCGNHIVWGAEKVTELSMRHIGQAHELFGGRMVAELRHYSESSASDLEAKIRSAQRFELGASKEKVLDFVFEKRILSRIKAEDAYDAAEANPSDGNPRSAWGFAQGITRIAQQAIYADRRLDMDKAATKIIEMAF